MIDVYEIFSSFGRKGEISARAPTQHVVDYAESEKGKGGATITLEENVTAYAEEQKAGRLDRWLDRVVEFSGSEICFSIVMLGLFTWAFLGIPYGQSAAWPVIISNVQAVLCYVYDSMIMRQHLNLYDRMVKVAASLRSRNISNRRMLRTIRESGRYQIKATNTLETDLAEISVELPNDSIFGRISSRSSKILGNFITVCAYWCCIFIWLAFGHNQHWSDRWQLYINSATSALMVLIFAFLANIGEAHNKYLKTCLDSIFEADSRLEYSLRKLTGDDTPNETVTVPAPKVGRIQRAVFYYADLVGTLTGIFILICFMVLWIILGPIMHFSENWWLILGTYAGLIGLNDGFVLRNVVYRFESYEDLAFDDVDIEDKATFQDLGLIAPSLPPVNEDTFTARASKVMGYFCAHQITALLGAFFVLGLVAGSSAMKWSTTGQLISNVPPSIIESFFMLILITGHNLTDKKRRVDLQTFLVRRVKLQKYVDELQSISSASSDA